MQIWWHGARSAGEGGNRGTIAEEEERRREREKEKARKKERRIKREENRGGPWASPRIGKNAGEKGGGGEALFLFAKIETLAVIIID